MKATTAATMVDAFSKTLCDLHTHTCASDGQYSATELVARAKALNLVALAITDHDTTAGWEGLLIDKANKAGETDKADEIGEIVEAGETNKASEKGAVKYSSENTNFEHLLQDAPKTFGETSPIIRFGTLDVIKGIEISVLFPTGECHILGLGLRFVSNELARVCQKLQAGRAERNKLIIKKLQEHGLALTLEDIEREAKGEDNSPSLVIGRPHIAQYLARHGFVKDERAAFEKYLGKGRPCYFDRYYCPLGEAVGAIKSSRGVAVLAHPMSLYLSFSRLKTVLHNFHLAGVEGLEAYHPAATVGQCKKLEALAREEGLFVTAGSDFHGELIRKDRTLAHTAGGEEISADYYFLKVRGRIGG